MPQQHRRLALLTTALALTACHEPSDSLDAEDVATWANTGSALGVYTHLHTPIAFAVGQSPFVDPACPTTTDDGTTVTITGGCTDSEGQRFEGDVTITRVDGPRDLDLTYNGYGSSQGEVARTTGTATVRQLAASQYSYEVNLVQVGGVTTEIDYSGTIAGDYDQPTLWNGSGTIIRSGDFEPTGTAEAVTVDQRVDDAICSGQSSSGETTIEVDGHVIVVSYDGESDCDEAQAARWSLDGVDRGLVEGITCAVTAGDSRGAGAMLCVLALLGIAGARRRREASAP
jgi:hypothetical protein